MTKKPFIPGAVFVVGLAAFIGSGPAVVSSGAPEPLPPPRVKGFTAFRFQGASSCAMAACHNAPGAPGAPGSEYATWAAAPRGDRPGDKHAQAYDVLTNDRSRFIAANLKRGKPAHQDSLCLNCHVVTDHDLVKERLPSFFTTDGVSCESCHGPAERWLAEHYRPEWKALKREEKAAYGMKDMRSLPARAKVCAACHVGSLPAEKGGVGQDAYHDLYAAGHPPLVFEFAAYHATTLHHWQDARDKDPRQGGTPDFEARAWVAGQIVSAQAALDLLGQRAADAARPWPEFAEMDCFACHHDLKGKSWRQKRDADSPPRKAGVMPFRPWYVAMLERSLETLDKGEAKSVHEELESLRKRMEKTVPDRGAVSRQAKSLSSKLGPWLDKCDRAIDLDSLYQRIRKEDVPRARENWDTAAQTYLAVAALENAWNDLQVTATHGNLPSTLDAVRRELRWPKGYWSPPAFDGLSVLKKLERLRN